MNRKNKIILLVAVIVVIVVGIYIYRLIYPNEPPQVEITNQALEAAKQENADMKRRLEELEKQVRQGAKQIRQEERVKVDAMPPDAIAVAVADELRLFLGSD